MKKKLLLMASSALLCGTLLYPKLHVGATEFVGKEDEYTQMCQDTTKLSKSDIEVCTAFSTYLKNKNSHIQNNINDTQSKLNGTLANIQEVQTTLEQTQTQIASVQAELLVLEGSISNLNKQIEEKKTQLKDRMYVLQSYINGNELKNLLFSSGSLDELLTRIQCIDELTNYDKDLITGLAKDRLTLEEKSEEMTVQFDNLFALQNQQTSLMLVLSQQAGNYESTLNSQNSLLSNYREDIGYIDSSLSEAEKRLEAEQDREEAEEEGKNEENQPPNEDSPIIPPSNNDSIKEALVNTALSKNGADYVYGGTGPNAFDCSGFAQWVYRQNGIYIPRTVTSQYYACDLVNTPEPGDLVFFNTFSFLGHVGIYIGNGQFIHAGTSDTGVYIANFYSSYWQSVYQGAGRFR